MKKLLPFIIGFLLLSTMGAVPMTHSTAGDHRVALAPASGMGPLKVSSANPRYFADPSGKIVYLTGSHTWNSLQHLSGAFWFLPNLISTRGYAAYLDELQAHGHNFIRFWTLEHTWNATDGSQASPHPWLRTGPGTALDGKPRFDLTKFDPTYFTRLRQRTAAAQSRGVYVSVMLFGGMWGTEHASTWKGHPFNRSNNINGIGADADGDGLANGATELYTLKAPAAVLTVQRAHVRKVIDTLNDLDNVLYEVANEVRAWNTGWQYEMIEEVRRYQASKPRQHPVGMTGYATIPNSDLYKSAADWISPSQQPGADYMTDPPAASGRKVILIDTDHLWGVGGDQLWVWKSFLRGLNPIYMDNLDANAVRERARKAMGQTRHYANRVNLAAMTPSTTLCSTAYCLAQPGTEYLVYAPSGGSFALTLVEGTYRYEWFNPSTGTIAGTGSFAARSGNRSFTPPFLGHAVLYLMR